MSDKTHYRKLHPSNFLGSHDLDGKDYTLTISKVHKEGVMNVETHQKEDKVVIEFEKTKKPWVCNITNMKRIAKHHGNYIEDWIGKKITLTTEKVRAFGEVQDAVRVVPVGGNARSLKDV